MTTTRIIATVAFAAIAILTTNANAQTNARAAVQVIDNQGPDHIIQQRVETRVVPEAVILPLPPAPKLGFMGQMVYGLGMRVMSVNYGSPAQRAGLEHGDIIMSANGIQIRNQGDLSQALRNAVQFNNGSVNLYVKNIRGNAWQGNEYVNVNAQLFGGPIQTMGATTNEVVNN